MIRTVLLVVEILLAVAALGGGAAAILRSRDESAGEEGQTIAKRQMLVDVAMMDVVLAVMAVAAWAVYLERSWARWMSIIAGAVLVAVLVVRPRLAGRQWVASLAALLGVLVAVLAIFLPGG